MAASKRYTNYDLMLSNNQIERIVNAAKKNEPVTIRLNQDSETSAHKIPLTKTQISRIKNAKSNINLRLSAAQLKYMEKSGGFLPLLALLPLIFGGLGAAGGVAGGIASAVSSANNARAAAAAQAEQERHNREIESQLAAQQSGSGFISDYAGKVPIIGNFLSSLLKKMGLGIQDINKIKKGGCIECDGLCIKKSGDGLFLGPQGSGLFLGPEPR